jgi:RNA polymerase sigma factor (sigma-70 family)
MRVVENESARDMSQLIELVAAGDQGAFESLWNLWYPELRSSVRQKISHLPRLANDASDLASEAMHKFFDRAIVRQDYELENPGSVWGLLRNFAFGLIQDHIKAMQTDKRGGRVSTISLDEPMVGNRQRNHSSHDAMSFGQSLQDNKQDSPLEKVCMSELLDLLLERIDKEKPKRILLMKLAGNSNKEIAEQLKVSLRTVERYLIKIESTMRELSGD